MTRRVVTGFDSAGRSIIVNDQEVSSVASRPDGSLVMDVWRTPSLPTRFDVDDAASGVGLPPPPGGLVVRTCSFAPNAEMDAETYERALAEAYGVDAPGSPVAGAAPGMHRTDTVDVVTLVSGELYLVLENGETLLRPGDTVVQRGTRHAWHNRSDRPALVVAVMMAAH